jgi:bifunctional non-homologous end joining protein LigD
VSHRRLEEYRSKRAFGRTPEPAPRRRPRRRTPEHLFVVHKHDARRLHYDLRLETEGVLASWAIPKGPSLDPAERRLAVQTEDHPLEYADFEGRIPEGEYGAGDSLIWDRGTYRTDPPEREREMLEAGRMTVIFDGEKLHGRWHLIRTRRAGNKMQWLFFKGRDRFASAERDLVRERPESVRSGKKVTRGPLRASAARAAHPPPIDLLLRVWPPMKAVLSKRESVVTGDWVFEVKYDGFRALAAISGGRIALQSRNGRDLSVRFPQVARALATMPLAEAVLDGEIVAEAGGFAALPTSKKLRYCVFDLLWLDGEDQRQRPLEERRDLLESILANAALPLSLAERIPGTIDQALGAARRRQLEGVVAKRRGSIYEGRRSPSWRKVKIVASQELAIVGFTARSDGAKAIGALLLGIHERGRFVYAGKVGTGFDQKMQRELWRRLDRERVSEPSAVSAKRIKDAIWVRPTLVAEVAFTEWTRDGALRHPSFRGLRIDKRPEECIRERPR